ncbi:MAG: trehalose-phosphatase [Deltaproteobacteria bacterium]|nr:trehalose-phosphatase [Deltaproteobacteria bacterium]
MPDLAEWRSLVTREPVAFLVDIDGTLVDYAATPQLAPLEATTTEVLTELAATGAHVVIVSGRPLESVASLVPLVPGATWVAEHGAWRRLGATWEGPQRTNPELDDLAETLSLLARAPGARFERKSLSVCFHWRMVTEPARTVLVEAAEVACEQWLDTNADNELLFGQDSIEVRPRHVHKGSIVRTIRDRIPGVRIIALGHDVTAGDMFRELVPGDAAITIGGSCARTSMAATLADPPAVRAFLSWATNQRAGRITVAPPLGPAVTTCLVPGQRALVVLSNRMPEPSVSRRREVGGLVAALEPALAERSAIWLGWSGHDREVPGAPVIDALARPTRAAFDLQPELRARYYSGFCNRALWPLFHQFPGRVRYTDDDWTAYVEANQIFARHAAALTTIDGTIWIHDYHLLLVARELRALGHRGPIGLFLHVPFPPRDMLETLPWRGEIISALLELDLIGVHAKRWQENLLSSVVASGAATLDGCRLVRPERSTEVGVYPIGIDPTPFREVIEDSPDVEGLRVALGDRKLVLGVDRLDYSKGVPERLLAFECLLERCPDWRRRISFIQISVPSRAEIPEYAEIRARVESLVGRINGRFGEADWVPVRYLYRSFSHQVLAQLYRLADVALVTPLRDGMNLVAKEFVVSQDPTRPGVLVLSQFAGAAEQLSAALLTNPYHPNGLAADLDIALRMPAEERIARHRLLSAAIERGGDASAWATAFLDRLESVVAEEATCDRRKLTSRG